MNAEVIAPEMSTSCRFSASVVTSTSVFSIGLARYVETYGSTGVDKVGDCADLLTMGNDRRGARKLTVAGREPLNDPLLPGASERTRAKAGLDEGGAFSLTRSTGVVV